LLEQQIQSTIVRGLLLMSENVASGASSGDPLKSVADALETAVQAAKDGAADAKATVERALPAASRFLSRFVYTTCYTMSYGVVFPTVLIAKSIPTNNAVVNGFVDGARAASDMVEQLKSRQIMSSNPASSPSLPS
jgi:hypothetical protein